MSFTVTQEAPQASLQYPGAVQLNHLHPSRSRSSQTSIRPHQEPTSSGKPTSEPRRLGEEENHIQGIGGNDPPPDAQTEVSKWNYPRKNIGKLGFCFVSFIVTGMNDGATGVCILTRI